MIAAALLLQAVAPPAPAPPPPPEWSILPELPVALPRGASDPSGYVRREVAAGRCAAARIAGESRVVAPVAVFFDAAGAVRRVVPGAVGCPTVEQFTAGYVSTLARRAAAGRAIPSGWYRHVVTYRWTG
ncbi:hypothetical protein [uncultured Sphingomonas sp.]|uniref:hypothetical protein n=1 Tax=uncultured Sphingomonas sp. TaxID=158754 RepID=UPI0035C9EE49